MKIDWKKEVIEASETKPVLVDFWAAWCGPCQLLKKEIKKIHEEGKYGVVEVNVEEEMELSREYKISSIPHVKLFYKGKEVSHFTGMKPKVIIDSWVEEALGN